MFTITEIPHVNPLLNQIKVQHSETEFQAVIYPQLGASLQELIVKKTPLIAGIPQDEAGLESYAGAYNSSFLFPFPNRIAQGKYNFENTEYQLECNENGRNNAIHGCIDHANFELDTYECTKEYAEVSLTYSHTSKVAGFPFSFDCAINYRFSEATVAISLSVKNTDTVNFPYGFGWHPYFLMDNFDETMLSFDGDKQVDCDTEMIPTGSSKHGLDSEFKLKGHQFDTGFIQETSASALETDRYKVSFTTSDNLEAFLQVYTPPHGKSIAIEPMTCIADAFNNKTGVRVLTSNETVIWDINMNVHIK